MELLILVLLILLNGFFALSEIALVSSKPLRLQQCRNEGSRGAAVALKLLDHSENFLSAIQVGITLIGIVTGVYGGTSIADDVSPFFERFALTAPYARQIALTLTVLVITFVSIVIGELVPKTFALSDPERIAARIAPVIWYFSKLFYPFVWLLGVSTTLVNRMLGIRKHEERITEAELRQMMKQASTEGVIEQEQTRMHERVFYFSDKKARHIMTHHSDLEWVDLDDPADEVRKTIMSATHARIVVCQGSIDHFLGILSVRDYLVHLQTDASVDIRALLYQPLILHENMPAPAVLNLFRQRQRHIAVVIDEYGCLQGIITLHDIVENLVGEIPYEGESCEPDICIREDRSVLVNGEAPVETLAEVIDPFTVDFENIDYSTVAGFVLAHLNKIPQTGDTFEYEGYTVEIVDMDGHKIDKILVRKNPERTEEPADE